MTLDPTSIAALGTACLLLMLLAAQRRQRARTLARRSAHKEAIDTVIGWRPEATRVLASHDLAAMRTLVEAMPGHLVLSQVPLARFLRVPTRHSYAEWLARVGNVNADLLLCDAESRVLAVVDVRASQESERSRRRHERMARVLREAAIPVLVWRQDQLPTPTQACAQLHALTGTRRSRPASHRAAAAPSSGAMPLMPLPEVTELLAEGDAQAAAAELSEPVPSGFYDELEIGAAGGAH